METKPISQIILSGEPLDEDAIPFETLLRELQGVMRNAGYSDVIAVQAVEEESQS